MDELTDAIIEDTWHWTCPNCRALNSDVLGSDDFVRCWRCGEVYKMAENGDGLIACVQCSECFGDGATMTTEMRLLKCRRCEGHGAVPNPAMGQWPAKELDDMLPLPQDFGTDRREAIAAVQHDIWAHWMAYVFKICHQDFYGNVIVPEELVNHWTRQINTPYDSLTEQEKNSDREQADKVLAVLQGEPHEETAL